MVIYGRFSFFITYTFNLLIYLTTTNNLVYPVNWCSHYTNIVSNQIQASITCLFLFIYVNKILLLTKCFMRGFSNQNICAITTQVELSIFIFSYVPCIVFLLAYIAFT